MQMVKLPKGKYVVAVSGGVDSMALLDMLRRQSGLELVVVHVNHGIRSDAIEDERLTRLFCMSHNITYHCERLYLKASVSEDEARKARYNVLQQYRINENALAIVTAHHQDDLIETVIINLLRGTGWRGLAPFSQSYVLRPLLDITKKQLVDYVTKHSVPWREDTTNANQNYLRNYVRLSLIPRLTKLDYTWRYTLLQQVRKQQQLRRTIEAELQVLHKNLTTKEVKKSSLPRYQLIMLPSEIAYELLQTTFRDLLGNSLVKKRAQAVLLFAKVARVGKKMPLAPGWQARAAVRSLIVEPTATVVS